MRPSDTAETLIVALQPGQFSGETNMITGRPSLARTRVTAAGELIELDQEQLLTLVQTDPELSEILMRAFILRRVELIARGYGDVVLIGSTHCSSTLRDEGVPHSQRPSARTIVDLDRESETPGAASIGFTSAPPTSRSSSVVVETVLRNPANRADRGVPRFQ